ncbi:sugar phosphate isomerase/epimerase [Metabacillus dongyingensis]|uniref:sugar phosphate isomerase/epimerase family protein n=1 Tax=Metabacillus dongyingensis TaxID=2874282 RepID=UPI003B8E82E9
MKIGLQLYTLRDELSKDFISTLRKVADIGYQGLEFAGYGGLQPEELKDVLEQLNIKSLGSHVSIDRLKHALDEEININRFIGSEYVVCPGLPLEMRNSLDAIKETALLFTEYGMKFAEHGIQFCYHNHSFEFEEKIADELLFDRLMNAASEKFMGIELDVCWVYNAGYDPLIYLKEYNGRIPLLHVKDIIHAGTKAAETVELGKGEMDLIPILDAAVKNKVQWLIVEQDECSNPPLECVETSFKWLKNTIEQ